MHSSILGNDYESQVVTAFSSSYSTRKCNFLAYLGAKMTGKARPVRTGSMKFIASVLSIFNVLKSQTFGPARYGTKYIKRLTANYNTTRFLTVDIRPRCPSHILKNIPSILRNSSRYFMYLSGTDIDSRQALIFLSSRIIVEDRLSIVTLLTTFIDDESFLDVCTSVSEVHICRH